MAIRITLQQCAKTFAGGVRALEPLDLVIEPGECLVLLGPSGCGKTTLLRLIAGLAQPDSGGHILFGNDDVTDRPIEARRVGMVFQSYALFPNLNVAQNIGYGLKIRGDTRAAIEARVASLMRLVQLDGYGERRVDELSGGQKQRVALARALAIEPAVLLLDEPLTALDAKLRETLRIELKRLLHAVGVTSVFVTHDQAEAMALGDRIAVLSKGRIEQIGSAQDIYNRPASRFVAEFVGQVNHVRLPGIGEVLVRPESVRLSRPDLFGQLAAGRSASTTTTVGERGNTHLPGKIRIATFLGNLSQYEIELDDAQVVRVESATAGLAAAAGERVVLEFDPATFLNLPP